MRIKYFLLILFLIIFSNSVISQPPFTETFGGTIGLQIQAPVFEYYVFGESAGLTVRVFNLSTGELLNNNSYVGCEAHVYNINGSELIHIENAEPYKDGFNFAYNDSIIPSIGIYSFSIHCNTTNSGSYITDYFEVTATGTTLSLSSTIIYSLLLIVFITLMIMSLIGAVKINGKNEFTMGGDVLRVNFNKYLKIGLYALSYLFLLFVVFISYGISKSFLYLNMVTDILYIVNYLLWILLAPLFIALVVVALIKFVLDLRLQDLAKRNLRPRKGTKKKW